MTVIRVPRPRAGDSYAARWTAPKVCAPNLFDRAHEKLFLVDDAERLEDLRVLPGNRLEALEGDRAGEHSIRINRQYRICIRWRDGAARDVEITDYHP